MNIQGLADKLKCGGKIYLKTDCYNIEETIVIDTPCICLEGEVWNYSSDPNGVFESPYGTKLRLCTNNIPALCVGRDNVLGGNVIKNIGIQGNIKGMDTRGMFSFENPSAASGICFLGKRVDQAEVSKVSCCGLGSAICVTGSAEIDGCTFEKINTDGCCIGFYYAPEASYYTKFKSCVCADNPWYGFFAKGDNALLHNMDIDGFHFVRCGGAFPQDFPYPRAAVCFYKVNNCALRNNIFDAPGTFWYYDDDATENTQRQISETTVPSLWIEGNGNRISGNVFSNCPSDAIVINGSGNIIMNNISDGNIVINGPDNILCGNVFTNENAKIVISPGFEESTKFSV